MPSELLINVCAVETRVALLERGRLREISIERSGDRGISGNIYKAKVERVLPGMQAAFLNAGLDRSVFLYAGDVRGDFDDAEGAGEAAEEGEDGELAQVAHEAGAPPIEGLLRGGQEVLVQVAKEPLGTKGARVTSYISLPGRLLVYMPLLGHVGVSRRIASEGERERLRELLCRMQDGRGGFIVRTAAEGASEDELRRDVTYLSKLWEKIRARQDAAAPGTLIHEELSVSLRALRDVVTPEIGAIVIDDPAECERVREFLGAFEPHLCSRVTLYRDSEPLFDRRGIEVEIERLHARKLWLPSGGTIVIDSFEALTAIDVNTGRYVGKRDFEETVLKTNLEAVGEIAAQLRLRNIGGIVAIDFIDMQRPGSRERVQDALADALRGDKARTTCTPMSELGVIELTRKRIRAPVLSALCEPCPYCEGAGTIKSLATVAHEVLRQLVREVNAAAGDKLAVRAHPAVIARLREDDHRGLAQIEAERGITVRLSEEPAYHREHFEIAAVSR